MQDCNYIVSMFQVAFIPVYVIMELSNGAQVIELQDNGDQVQRSQNLQSISFHDITYKVKQSKHCRRISNKVILNSVRYVLEVDSILAAAS